MSKTAMVVPISLLLGSCASTQLNYNALDIAGTYDTLLTRQVIHNLKRTFASPYGIPAVVKVTSQTATTTGSVTPSYTAPITGAVSAMVNGRSYSRAGAGLGVGFSDQWTQSYSMNPVFDTDQLRRLTILFQYVTRTAGVTDDILEATYPLIVTNDTRPALGKPAKSDDSSRESQIVYVRKAFRIKGGEFGSFAYQVVSPDETFIRTPGCILCDYGRRLTRTDALFDQDTRDKVSAATLGRTRILEKNKSLTNDWLYAPDDPIPSDAVPLPDQDIGGLFVKGDTNGAKSYGLQLFYEFVLLTEDAASQGTGSPASGGQSNGRKTTPIERVSIPVSGATFVP